MIRTASNLAAKFSPLQEFVTYTEFALANAIITINKPVINPEQSEINSSTMFLRLILLIAVVAAVLWLLKKLFAGADDNGGSSKPKTENMRQCKYCGTHVPESMLVISGDQPYCCQDHADRDQS